jgi:ketosteroid isomerase-like protein
MNNESLLLAAATFVFAFQLGCTQAPPPAPPDTRAADEQAIRSSEVTWVKEFAAKDVDKVVAHYADDASTMGTNAPLATGTAAIRSGVKDGFADPKFMLDFHATKVEVSKGGDLAYTQGTFTFTGTNPKTKKVMNEKGNYVEVYKKQPDGSWKVVEDISSDDSLPTPAKATK